METFMKFIRSMNWSSIWQRLMTQWMTGTNVSGRVFMYVEGGHFEQINMLQQHTYANV